MSEYMPIILALFGIIGGGGGIYSGITAVATRRKVLAEADRAAADTNIVIGKAAVELLAPFRERVQELEVDVAEARETAAAAKAEVADLRDCVVELTGVLNRWRSAILHPAANLDQLRHMVTADSNPDYRNGRPSHT